MQIKPNFNRVIKTLHHEEPDRVPLADAAISYEIMSKYLEKNVTDDDINLQVEFWQKAGYDYIPITVGMMQPGKVTEDSAISKMIKKVLVQDTASQTDDRSWNLELKSFINNEADFEKFPWEEAAKLDLSKFYEVQQYLPEGMKIIALSGKIFTLSWLLMGFENFCMNLMSNPKFINRVLAKVAEIQYGVLKTVLDIPNVAAVWAVDDLAFGTGTMISPKDIRKHIFPWYKTFGDICREKNKYMFFHSDGVLWDIMDDLIDIGIHAIHPIDPTCMDIEEVKKAYGKKICLIGNIDNDLLMRGTQEDIIELTKKRINALAPGGGYCVGSGNSVPEWASICNYRAMVETTLRHGQYPLIRLQKNN